MTTGRGRVGRCGCGTAGLILWLTGAALAHPASPPGPGDVWTAWGSDAWILGPVAFTGWMYARGVRRLRASAGRDSVVGPARALSFYTGLVTIAVALVSPLAELSTALFSAHMVQHLALMLAAAPLIALGFPHIALAWAFDSRRHDRVAGWLVRRSRVHAAWDSLARPGVALALNTAILWTWHLPALYEAALWNRGIHILQHTMFLGAALLVWTSFLSPGRQRQLRFGTAVLLIFGSGLQGGMLALVLTFARTRWYPSHDAGAPLWGLTPLEDQQLAGAVMWVPTGIVYLVTASVFVLAWLREMERLQPGGRRGPVPRRSLEG